MGHRKDGKNLIEQWLLQNEGNATHPRNASYVQTVEELLSVDPSKTDRLLGLFSNTDLAFYHDQAADRDPTLTDMAEKAIQILSKNPNGFFLFVEGSYINL